MTWFDGLLLLAVLIAVLFEARQEAGRGLLDAVATLAAVALSRLLAPSMTSALHWKPMPGTDISPGAQGLCFLALWGACLVASYYLHRQTRWSMDHFDLAFGVVFGLLIAVAAGHVLTDVGARMAIMKHGHLPAYYSNSYLADELRSFRSYHYVINTFEAAQRGD